MALLWIVPSFVISGSLLGETLRGGLWTNYVKNVLLRQLSESGRHITLACQAALCNSLNCLAVAGITLFDFISNEFVDFCRKVVKKKK